MTPSGVRRSLTISQGIAEGTRGEILEKSTPSPKKEEIAERRAKVATMVRKRSRDSSPVFNSTREMQRALLQRSFERLR
jgi:hypothetical protein